MPSTTRYDNTVWAIEEGKDYSTGDMFVFDATPSGQDTGWPAGATGFFGAPDVEDEVVLLHPAGPHLPEPQAEQCVELIFFNDGWDYQ